MVSRGAYCLCVYVKDEVDVEVGALGRLSFAPGRYIYVGSALNGLIARVTRHVNTSRGVHKAIRWHIDYLLKEPVVDIESVYTRLTDMRIECDLAGEVAQRGEPVKGFGCSDCGCVSHLFLVEGFCFLSDLGLKRWPNSQLEPDDINSI
jgi:Uri superfamily endonuclease